MDRLTIADVEVAVDKVLAALAQLEAARHNLLTSLKTLERLSRSFDALASISRPGPQHRV